MSDERLSLAFLMDGGAGNRFVQMNFIYCVSEYLANENVDFVVFGHKSAEFNDLLMKNQPFISSYYSPDKSYLGYECDAYVQLEFYPDVLNEKESVAKKSSKLHNLLIKWREFSNEPFRRYGLIHPHEHYQAYVYGINNNKNVLNGMDAMSILGIGRSYEWKLDIDDNISFIEKYCLKHNEYITIQRGATPSSSNKENPRLWPVRHYEELIRLLHVVYPEKKIVQLGEESNSAAIDGVDVNLLSKTTWNELGIVLKHAWLHIDGDCGMMHYRKAIGAGPTVALFGHTPVEYCGYYDNINITSHGCPHWCARLTDSWMDRCPRGFDEPKCMAEITPAMVLNRIKLWECTKQVKDKGFVDCKFVNTELYSEYDIDGKYKRDYLDLYSIYYYEPENISADKLKVYQVSDNGDGFIPLSKSAAFAAAQGNWKCYEDYLVLLRAFDGNSIHTVEKFKELIKMLENDGLNPKKPLLIDEENRVLDGQHRLAWYAAKHGLESSVHVVRLYTVNMEDHDLFPYDKVPKGSNIAIYGAGRQGGSYVRQLKETGYVNELYLVDQNPRRWNEVTRNRELIECLPVSDIQNLDVDVVVIAVRNKKVKEEIKRTLEGIEIL